jgi:hypothetical protein
MIKFLKIEFYYRLAIYHAKKTDKIDHLKYKHAFRYHADKFNYYTEKINNLRR